MYNVTYKYLLLNCVLEHYIIQINNSSDSITIVYSEPKIDNYPKIPNGLGGQLKP